MPTKSALRNKEALETAIAVSSSMKEVLERMGLRAAGGNFRTLKAVAEEYDLDLPVYERNMVECRRSRLPLVDVLIEGSSYSRTNLRKRLVQEGLLAERCAECGMAPKWNGKSLTLQLDHINGVHNDNQLKNLRLLCPNCHSQTETFAGRASRLPSDRHRDECQCGGRKLKQSATCGCSRQTKIDWPSVDEVQRMVEETSYSATGRALGVSDNAVRKFLRTHS